MFINIGYSIHRVLFYTKISPSTWYKRQTKSLLVKKESDCKSPQGRPLKVTTTFDGKIIDDSTIKNYLKNLREKKFFSKIGYRKLTHYLKRDHDLVINHKKVFRLYCEAGLTLPKKKKTKRQGKKICENRTVTGPNQLWQFDIKYGYIDGENRFFYLMAFVDVFNRKVVEYHIGSHCTAKDILIHLEMALKKDGVNSANLVIRSDNGPQMTSYQFKKKIESFGIEHEFTPPSTPNLNAYVESFFSIVDRELFQGRLYESFSEAYEEVIDFIKHYNNERIHGSLKMITPNEFTERYEKSIKSDTNLVA